MKKLFLIVLAMMFAAISFVPVVEARQVPINFNWLYEPSKIPEGWTVDQIIGITQKICVYQSNDMEVTWVKVQEFPISNFQLPMPVAGWPVSFNIELADGAIYSLHFAASEVNTNGVESVKSNWLPFTFDLRPMPSVQPTIQKP